MIEAAALEHKTKSEFKERKPYAYQTAIKRGILDQVCSHMSGKVKWTKEMIQAAALEHETRHEFEKRNNAAYRAAQYHGILDKVCCHMGDVFTYWTNEMLQVAALEYETRGEFARHKNAAYRAALNRGILDQICQHMERGITGYNPEKSGTFYVYYGDFVGFGETNDFKRRNKEHEAKFKLHNVHMVLRYRFESEDGYMIQNLERATKKHFIKHTINTGIDGFKTESLPNSMYDDLISFVRNFIDNYYPISP